MERLSVVCALAVSTMLALSARAGVTNGSFETGDLTGWTMPAGAPIEVVTGHTDPDGSGTTSWGPTNGSYFALLKSVGLGSLSLLYQSSYFTPDSVLTFDYFWDSGNSKPSDDSASMSIYSGVGLEGPFIAGVTLGSVNGDPQDQWGTAWNSLSRWLPAAGVYTVAFEVHSDGLSSNDSYLGIDNVSVLQAVPTPGTIMLAGIGVGLVGWLRRRKTL